MKLFGSGRKALLFILVSICAGLGSMSNVRSEPLGIGSMGPGSPSYVMALAIAQAAKEQAGLELLPKPFKSTGQAVPLVDKGELSFGLSNAAELAAAWNGTGTFEGHSAKSLRLIARLFPLRLALAVRKDDPARTLADLKGRTLPSGFSATTTGEQLVAAMLSTAGLTYGDVKTVKVAEFLAMREAFLDHRTDVTIFIIGSGADAEIARKVGGVRLLELPEGEDTEAKIKSILPVARTEMLDPKDGASLIDKPTRIMSYDFYLYANEGAPADIMQPLITSLLEGHETLVATYPPFSSLTRETIVGDIGVPYHPAAEKYYRDSKLWPASP